MKHILLTGGTGIIGSYFINLLLKNKYKVYALARDKKNNDARSRLFSKLLFWDKGVKKHLKNVAVLKGDVTESHLGLNKKDITRLAECITDIFHFSAITNFSYPLDKIRIINVNGTENVLNLSRILSEKGCLQRINHISTAYVCGDFKGRFTEDDLDVNQKFKTPYEHSKYEAELLVNKYRRYGLWIDIFRLPAVFPESTTGRTPHQQAFTQMLNILRQELFNILPIINVKATTVDNVCKAIYSIFINTKEKNRTYHIFGARNVPFKDILNTACKLLEVKKPRLVPFNNILTKNLSAVQKAILNGNLSFINRDIDLDSSYTISELKKYGYTFPDIDKKVINNLVSGFVSRKYKYIE